MSKSIEQFIKEQALLNAIEYSGKANPKALISRVIGEYQEYKSKMKELIPLIEKIVSEINSMSSNEQANEIEKLGVKLKKKPIKKDLSDLPDAIDGKVIMRFAPNPNGSLSLGHARQLILNWLYSKRYNGKFVLRLDDTDAKIKTPIKEAYKWIEDDAKWLGIIPDVIVKASDRFDIYYDYAKKLIEMDKAYVCTCEAEEFRKLKASAIACKCRVLSSKENLNRWNNMFTTYKEGDAVLRIKTDIKHKNPALRDWPAFRIIDNPKHPYLNVKVWPLYDFASSIDDHLLGITHIIRGIDFVVTEQKQGYLYKYFNWIYPKNLVTGKLLVSGVKSTTESRRLIAEGVFTGWNDLRLGNLKSLQRRGFCPQAIIDFIKAIGTTKGDVNISLENLYAVNKKYIDPVSDRYFFVANPIKMEIKGIDKYTAELVKHPDNNSRGTRKIKMNGPVLVSTDDIELFKSGKKIRLKGLFNIIIKSVSKDLIIAEFVSQEIDKTIPIIHWVPNKDNIEAEVIMPDMISIKGNLENNCKNLKTGTMIQLERFGFANLENKKPFRFIYTHK
ncbi:MAG: glutamate--tRNA ligase [DPANN group archaeon]|nr:glutamate--tRNA ligase [DPANN group archaeon]